MNLYIKITEKNGDTYSGHKTVDFGKIRKEEALRQINYMLSGGDKPIQNLSNVHSCNENGIVFVTKNGNTLI